MAQVVQILISHSPASPMLPQAEARAVAGRGLEGDRYFFGRGTFTPPTPQPDFELTLIESESIENFVRETGISFTAADSRRNLVTVGIALNPLVGHEFSIGAVRLKGIRLCEPCNYLAKQTRPEILKGLARQGGLRAQILTGGVIKLGAVVIATSQGSPAPASVGI